MSSTTPGNRPAGTAPGRLAPLVPVTRAALSMRTPVLGRRAQLASLYLRIIGAGLLSWIGAIHVRLWQEGYRFIPTNGPLFLLDGIAAFVLAAALLLRAVPGVGLAAAAFASATLGALVISLTVGLFGFRESLSASFVMLSIVIESGVIVLLAGWTGLVARAASHNR
jgi:hypothetical protein